SVSNVNDNAPIISSNGGGATAAITIAENSTAVTTRSEERRVGKECMTYSITGGAKEDKFSIDATTGALSFVSAPDYENPTDAGGNNVYDVVVEVSDGPEFGRLAIAVSVSNVNDNAPIISSNGGGATAAITIAENSTAVTTVTASDRSEERRVGKESSGGADAAKFSIDATTGALSFVSAPDYENPTDASGKHDTDLVVQWTSDVCSSDLAIAVSVSNVNDNAPIISSNGGGATAAITIAENSTAVTTVTASD